MEFAGQAKTIWLRCGQSAAYDFAEDSQGTAGCTQPGRAAEIKAIGIGKSFGSFRALDDLTLDIGRGEFLTLLGPSGSGKTTFLMILAGFVPPTDGTLISDGVDITDLPAEKRAAGMVFQGYALFPHMTVEANIAFPLKVRQKSRRRHQDARRRDDRARRPAAAMDTKLPRQLSGGQQQRVALARALVFEPGVLLLDEPFSALDKSLRGQMQDEMKRLHQETGTTFVFVTHDQSEALALSSRVAIFNHGELLQVGAPQDVYDRPANRFVAEFLGEINMLPLTDVQAGERRRDRALRGPRRSGFGAADGRRRRHARHPARIHVGARERRGRRERHRRRRHRLDLSRRRDAARPDDAAGREAHRLGADRRVAAAALARRQCSLADLAGRTRLSALPAGQLMHDCNDDTDTTKNKRRMTMTDRHSKTSPRAVGEITPPQLHAVGGRAARRHGRCAQPSRLFAQAKELVLVNWGGDAITAYDKAYGEPFKAETGITVKEDGSGPTEGAIAAQFKSGKPTWDLVDADPFSAMALGKQGMIEPIDYTIVDKTKFREGFGWEHAASTYFFSYIIAYDSSKFGDKVPTGMADFFDVEKFPGKRSLYKWGAGMWEAALLADGVEPDKLYPLDLKRAHDKIAAFKDNVVAYWGGGAESQAVLLNGEASMALIWSTRASVLSKRIPAARSSSSGTRA